MASRSFLGLNILLIRERQCIEFTVFGLQAIPNGAREGIEILPGKRKRNPRGKHMESGKTMAKIIKRCFTMSVKNQIISEKTIR
jgi:hypothetical protein